MASSCRRFAIHKGQARNHFENKSKPPPTPPIYFQTNTSLAFIKKARWQFLYVVYANDTTTLHICIAPTSHPPLRSCSVRPAFFSRGFAFGVGRPDLNLVILVVRRAHTRPSCERRRQRPTAHTQNAIVYCYIYLCYVQYKIHSVVSRYANIALDAHFITHTQKHIFVVSHSPSNHLIASSFVSFASLSSTLLSPPHTPSLPFNSSRVRPKETSQHPPISISFVAAPTSHHSRYFISTFRYSFCCCSFFLKPH